MLKKIFLAAMAMVSLAVFALAPAMPRAFRKSEAADSHEFDDFTSEGSLMSARHISCGEIAVRKSKTDHNPFGNDCYIGNGALGTEQVTVRSTNTNEVKADQHRLASSSSESSNSTIGIYEVTQLKARLA